MYLNPEKMASGAYCCPQSIPVEGFFTISDELTAILVENKGFVIITVAGDVVTAVKPDTAALEAWEENQAGTHQPCDPNSPCSGHEHLVTACPECGMMKTSGVPIGEVSRTATGSYDGIWDLNGPISQAPIELTFDFVPKFLMINVWNGGTISGTTMCNPSGGFGVCIGYSSNTFVTCSVSGTTVSFPFVDKTSAACVGATGRKYDYVAIG